MCCGDLKMMAAIPEPEVFVWDDWRGVGPETVNWTADHPAMMLAIASDSDVDQVTVKARGGVARLLSASTPLFGPFRGPLTIANVRTFPNAGVPSSTVLAAPKLSIEVHFAPPPFWPTRRAHKTRENDTLTIPNPSEDVIEHIPVYGRRIGSYIVTVSGGTLEYRIEGQKFRTGSTPHVHELYPTPGATTRKTVTNDTDVAVYDPEETYDFLAIKGLTTSAITVVRSLEFRD